jgi:hypothetical protein
MTLARLLAAVVAALDDVGIPHMVAGSVASTHHGEPRSTQDIDLVIAADRTQLIALVAKFDPDRYYLSDPIAALEERGQFNLIEPATGWKVDFILRHDRPFSHAEFSRRRPVQILGVATSIATAEDTVLAKLEWGRLGSSDRRDVVAVLVAQSERLDLAYLRHWAGELGLDAELDAALREADEIDGRGPQD